MAMMALPKLVLLAALAGAEESSSRNFGEPEWWDFRGPLQEAAATPAPAPTTDSGGDGCAWYAGENRKFCGSMDDEDFDALRDCQECQQNGGGIVSMKTMVEEIGGPLERFLRQYPAKTTSIMCGVCELVGSLPGNLSTRFPKLRSLDLRGNHLTGSIPKDLWRVPELQALVLSDNALTGTLEKEVGSAQKLRTLVLDGNRLEGSLPSELSEAKELRRLSLKRNSFSGALPAKLSATLQELDLSVNGFSGELPGTLVSNLGDLTTLSLESNKLRGALPAEMAALTSLQSLLLGENALSGGLPAEVARAFTQAAHIDLSLNAFSGELPREVGEWRGLRKLSLARNRFSGRLPVEVGNWREVEDINLAGNAFDGGIPSTVGSWQQLRFLDLSENGFTGLLPRAVESWASVESVQLSGNGLSGQLPTEIQGWRRASSLRLARNNFSGELPRELEGMEAISTLDVSGNGFRGWLRVSRFMEELNASGNELVGMGSEPSQLRIADLSRNRLVAVPDALLSSVILSDLRLNDNRISRWPLRGVVRNGSCLESRLIWHYLNSLDASENPLGDLTVFLSSLASLQSLAKLSCRRCGLQGAVSSEGLAEAEACGPEPAAKGFRTLQELDLSENSLTSIAAPPPKLKKADLSGNGLTSLDVAWFNEAAANGLQTLKIHGNPLLRANVAWPERPCDAKGMATLSADPAGYVETPHGFACTRLCPGLGTAYTADFTLNSSALCRCQAGHEGKGEGCAACAANSYSKEVAAGVRKCRGCPAHSATNGSAAEGIGACRCVAGAFLNAKEERCDFCAQHPFRSTRAAGADSPEACGCNASYAGLKEFAGRCGCDEGKFMSHARLACERCSHAEDCRWGLDIARSLKPPPVKPGFWREPVADVASFARNSVWRCASKGACPKDGGCAVGRTGTACGLCAPGMYGKPESRCWDCPESFSPEGQRLVIAAMCLALVPLPLLLHYALVAKQGGLEMLLHLRALKGSLKQMVKHAQTVGVIGKFSVSWPAPALVIFEMLSSFTLMDVPALSVVACTQRQTSALLEMGAKWALPLAFAAITLLAVPTSWLLQRLARPLRGTRLARFVPLEETLAMRAEDAGRVLLFAAFLFWSSIAANAVEALTCVPSPNGKYSLASYPHVLCSSESREFVLLLVLSVLALVLYVLTPLRLMWRGLEEAAASLAMSSLEDRGWFAFLFDDFRDGHLTWALRIVAKDALLVLVPALMPGWGAAQLLSTAALLAAHMLLVMRDRPFLEQSNSLLEAWNAATAAILCVYSVGMGYQRSLGIEEVEELFQEGAEDPIYRGRAVGMVIVQAVSITLPAAVLLFQLLCALPVTNRLLPRRLKPLTEQQLGSWVSSFLEHAGDLRSLGAVIRALDVADLSSFKAIFESTPATMEHALAKTSRSPLVKRRSSRKDSGLAAAAFGSEASMGSEASVAPCRTPSALIKATGTEFGLGRRESLSTGFSSSAPELLCSSEPTGP